MSTAYNARRRALKRARGLKRRPRAKALPKRPRGRNWYGSCEICSGKVFTAGARFCSDRCRKGRHNRKRMPPIREAA